MSIIIIIPVLTLSILLGMVVVWRIARKHHGILAAGAGLLAIGVIYVVLSWNPEIILIAMLPLSVLLGMVVVWRVAQKHHGILAVGAGLLLVAAIYTMLLLFESYRISLAKQAGCWDWCDMGYILYGGMAVVALAIVLIGGTITAVLVRNHPRMVSASTAA